MNKEYIKAKTNQKIAFANFERNEEMKKIKLKHISIIAISFIVFTTGILGVNAATDNSIGDAIEKTVKDILKVKVNDKDYNANCTIGDNGMYVCTVNTDDIETTIETPDPSNTDNEYIIKTVEY